MSGNDLPGMWNYLRFARNLGAIRGIRLLLMLSRLVKAQRNECDGASNALQ